MSAKSTALEQSESGRQQLQRRVALAGLFGGAMGWGFFLFRAIGVAVADKGHHFGDPSLWYHLAAANFLLMMWLTCRSGTRSAAFVYWIEAIGFIGAGSMYTVMGMYLTPAARPDFIVLLALTYGLMARAAYVPSTPRRTAVLSSLVALPAIAMTYYVMSRIDTAKWQHVLPDIAGKSSTQVGVDIATFNFAWWLCTVVLCTLTSRVIYGLRKEVRDVRKLGQYTLHSKLGEGGMGVVYRASHAMLRRPTAVKLLPPDKAGESALVRFEREVQLTASLSHPNTVTIHDYGRTPEGIFYYAMELLDGATLAEVVELSQAQPIGRVVHVLDHVAGALHEAHEVGLIHRDIKPANIMLVRAGGVLDVPKVLDFGLVKELESPEPSVSLAQGNQLTGTPQYISPEAIRAADTVDARSDLYALGAVAYFLVTGEHVFTGSTIVEVCSQHLHSTPEPPSERLGAEVPAALESLILDCLAKDPTKRPQDGLELKQRLTALRREHPWSAADAREWWERYGSGVTKLDRSSGTTPTDLTIAVDIQGRD